MKKVGEDNMRTETKEEKKPKLKPENTGLFNLHNM